MTKAYHGAAVWQKPGSRGLGASYFQLKTLFPRELLGRPGRAIKSMRRRYFTLNLLTRILRQTLETANPRT